MQATITNCIQRYSLLSIGGKEGGEEGGGGGGGGGGLTYEISS